MITEQRYLSITGSPKLLYTIAQNGMYNLHASTINNVDTNINLYIKGHRVAPPNVTIGSQLPSISSGFWSLKQGTLITGDATNNSQVSLLITGTPTDALFATNAANAAYVAEIPSGYVARWSLHDLNEANNTYSLASVGTHTTDIEGIWGDTIAAQGDGNYFVFPDLTGFPYDETTVSCFLRYDPSNSAYADVRLGTGTQWTDSRRRLRLYTDATGFHFTWGRGNVDNITGDYTLTLPTGQTWVHVSVSTTQTGLYSYGRVWIDGADQGTTANSKEIRSGDAINVLGGFITTSGYNYTGHHYGAEELIVHDRYLSAAEHAVIAQQG